MDSESPNLTLIFTPSRWSTMASKLATLQKMREHTVRLLDYNVINSYGVDMLPEITFVCLFISRFADIFTIMYKIEKQISGCFLITLETVDKNLGPDRFVGRKALDPYYCKQPTI